jgi:hypothetical protein
LFSSESENIDSFGDNVASIKILSLVENTCSLVAGEKSFAEEVLIPPITFRGLNRTLKSASIFHFLAVLLRDLQLAAVNLARSLDLRIRGHSTVFTLPEELRFSHLHLKYHVPRSKKRTDASRHALDLLANPASPGRSTME